jgi:hypothetical protein
MKRIEAVRAEGRCTRAGVCLYRSIRSIRFFRISKAVDVSHPSRLPETATAARCKPLTTLDTD